MMNSSDENRIFISYAKEDKAHAVRLYNDLQKSGYTPWLDELSLLPGQDWKLEIAEAIRNSQFFVALLSKSSTTKQGFVQAELKQAIDFMDELPDGKVFAIPVRLDDCCLKNVTLQKKQWVDMFPDWQEGLDRILKVISLEDRKRKVKAKLDVGSGNGRCSANSIDHYFFYISKDKITKIGCAKQDSADELDVTIRTLASVGISERMTAEYRRRCEELLTVLQQLGRSQEVVNLALSKTDLNGWAYAEVKLSIAGRSGKVLILEGEVGGLDLELACSEDSFLDYDPVRGELVMSSTNHWFFSGDHKYLFRTHFYILSVDDKGRRIKGSPLYLALPSGILES